ncbi:S-adenosyl-L-methionine-dependent methyltransferase [Truncatella angustata]|uniref:S-adenosyl-L-methionine-dependent methyltransferase n=1 Tax=Truncatella angustata TaxID=152316 RepID=A0A9P8UP50_9PEZI|nr:S-adenosyl-L-methionine-dependent methyltransferase [Truncatella angustata]KAH6656275.1 S-adenosyl-L-methionine-dependent methyltransferase [Truncatella angustata]
MEYDTKALASEALSSWETNAVYWDEGVGADGNKYWKSLQEPSLRRLLGDHLEGARALDLATANGLTARWLINNGCISVLATDGTEAMLEQAKKRASTNDEKFRIEYEQLDVTSPTAFEKLLEDPHTAGAFDIVLINMAIMDIANIEPLAEALPRLLKPDGVFVATVLHPVFFTSRATRQIEVSEYDSDITGKARTVRAKVIRDYLHIPPYRGVALYGQPAPQVYFHRPMHELFGIFFRAGLVMDQFEEPAFTEENEVKERIESHANFTQLPAILSFRLRKLA